MKTYALCLPDFSRLLALPLMTLNQAQAAQNMLANHGKTVMVINIKTA